MMRNRHHLERHADSISCLALSGEAAIVLVALSADLIVQGSAGPSVVVVAAAGQHTDVRAAVRDRKQISLSLPASGKPVGNKDPMDGPRSDG